VQISEKLFLEGCLVCWFLHSSLEERGGADVQLLIVLVA